MLNWIKVNKQWLFSGGGISIVAVVVWVANGIWQKNTEGASPIEQVLLAGFLVVIVFLILIGIFMLYRAVQASSSRREVGERLDSMDQKLKTIEAPRRFDDWHIAQRTVKPMLKRAVETEKEETLIQCMGVALHVSWKTVRETLEEYYATRKDMPKVTIELKILSSSWPKWKQLGRRWKRRNESFHESVLEFMEKHNGSPNLTLRLVEYHYTPNWHGILINRRHLFRSSCLYRDNEFTVHKNPYVYFREEENEYSEMQIDEFQHWFQYESKELSLDKVKEIVEGDLDETQ